MLPYCRFTDRARKVMQLANQEAQRLHHAQIDTEHLLLALIKVRRGMAARTLLGLGVDLEQARLEVERMAPPTPDERTLGKLPWSPRVGRIIVHSLEEARGLGHPYVGSEHLLLGLLREKEGIASQVLTGRLLDSARVREAVLARLQESQEQGTRTPPFSRRLGLWIHDHAKTVIFGIALLATLLGGWIGGILGDGQRDINAGALVGGGTVATVILSLGIARALRPIYRFHGLMQAPTYRLYENFSDRAREVIQMTYEEAQLLNHAYIGTEHILLGLLKQGSGTAVDVLKNLGIDLNMVRLEIEKIVLFAPQIVTLGKMPQTPRARKVIEYSIEEARNLNHAYVDTEHLLLGLVREQEGVASQVLMNLGVKLSQVREGIKSRMNLSEQPPKDDKS